MTYTLEIPIEAAHMAEAEKKAWRLLGGLPPGTPYRIRLEEPPQPQPTAPAPSILPFPAPAEIMELKASRMTYTLTIPIDAPTMTVAQAIAWKVLGMLPAGTPFAIKAQPEPQGGRRRAMSRDDYREAKASAPARRKRRRSALRADTTL